MQSSILVTGGSGQLACALAAHADVIRVGRPDLDFDRPDTIDTVLRAHRPAIVVNAAAWTAVDAAESHMEEADRANHTGPARMAARCREMGSRFIHISTDYVFSGDKGSPYVESDPVDPRSVYGSTKAAGEQAVLAACPDSIILRTAWVYSPYNRNFVRTMIEAAARRPELRVVSDQIGNPTSADALADVIMHIIARIRDTGWRPEYAGIYHAAGEGSASWYELACAAIKAAARHGNPEPVIEPITTADWPTPAHRPHDARLDCTRLKQVFDCAPGPWRPEVERVVGELMARQQP
ncbi:NAD(P)-dependent oxidoreductase [Komagataeibacter rhaeticus]|uniref:dTDP-4-dehydrorhamnose reductase n=2 Tax=Komagataeibacter rhaeticus TaxID=215221 RepID=UPI0004D7AD20|nr:dTDP-4-dehydrorhamnose reductase [Komagataeibacter rhaeticus]KDU96328.1 dTDP-4-dehydrorhamnose reductase [Komagataeibacter rhaeticus AF1]MBL7239548.1 dTDP-4-dehydrorhamnose reductase [Komagataeibacter rhaeticus]PYD53535.1 NAD(P)-dependent oxidoreductase [Komagataeibacter rhaeticus]GBQ09547.1 dTDP-4-dehydrorhamnose reductase [Komagataeibacter rhaeticus DSM 16663]